MNANQNIDAINPDKLKIREGSRRIERQEETWTQEGISLPGRDSQTTLLNCPLRWVFCLFVCLFCFVLFEAWLA